MSSKDITQELGDAPTPPSIAPPSPPASMAGSQGFRPVLATTAPIIFLAALRLTDTLVLLAHMGGDLSASLDDIVWVPQLYLGGYVGGALLATLLSFWLGRERCYLGSLILFTLAAALCGLSDSVWWLAGSSLVQGLGGGGVQAAARLLWVGASHPRWTWLAIALNVSSALAAIPVGPPLIDYLTENYGWRWLFWLTFLTAMLTLVPATLLLRRARTPDSAACAPAHRSGGR